MAAPWKPWLVTSTRPPMPAEAAAPPDLLTPETAMAAASASRARRSSTPTSGMSGSSKSSAGGFFANSAGSARPAKRSSGAARAMATARSASAAKPSLLRSLVETTACFLPTRTRRPEIVAFGALQFLDRAVAHLDRQRHAAHGEGVGLVGAGALGRGDGPFGDSARAVWSRSDDIGWRLVYAAVKIITRRRCGLRSRRISSARQPKRRLPRAICPAPATSRQSCGPFERATRPFNQDP